MRKGNLKTKIALEESSDDLIKEDIASFYDSPLRFVYYAFPWGKKGTSLERFKGPNDWQKKQLKRIGKQVKENAFDGFKAVNPIQEAVTSGHGIGKSTQVAWLILWIMSTRPQCKGIVTANSLPQLRSKTWAELDKWRKLAINSYWFYISLYALKFWHVSDKANWFTVGQSSKEENSESFAGQHNASSSSFYIFDEASAVPNKIWEVAAGGLTDGEPFWLVYGNPTRNSGRFRDCFGKEKHRWNTLRVDSRSVPLTNKKLIEEWIEDWGEDSDFIRVRVRGEFPRVGSKQFIDSSTIFEARKRKIKDSECSGLPRTLAVDVARFGDDLTVISERWGNRGIFLEKFAKQDTMQIAEYVADLLRKTKYNDCFIDAIGIGSGVVDRLKQLGFKVTEVVVSRAAYNKKEYSNLRTEMYAKFREWLKTADVPNDADLGDQLEAIEYFYSSKSQIALEPKDSMKKRLGSPDEADSLALHFAALPKPKVMDLEFHGI